MSNSHTKRLGLGMATLAALLMVVPSAHAKAPKEEPFTDAELMHEALYSCRHLGPKRRKTIDLEMFRKILELEREHGVPEEFRGMMLAKACIESGYKPGIKGDCVGDDCKAVGIIQLWPWSRRFGVDREDPYASVRFLLQRVQVGLKYLHRKCPQVKGKLEKWQLAWLRINRGPKQHGEQRCEGLPHGLKMLQMWQDNIRKDRVKQRLAERKAMRRAMRELAAEKRADDTPTATTGAPRRPHPTR